MFIKQYIPVVLSHNTVLSGNINSIMDIYEIYYIYLIKQASKYSIPDIRCFTSRTNIRTSRKTCSTKPNQYIVIIIILGDGSKYVA